MIFCMNININVFYNLTVSFLMIIARHAQSTQNRKFASFCNISKKKGEMKLIFYIQINIKLSYILILLIVVGMVRHAQMIQNNMLEMGCLKEVEYV